MRYVYILRCADNTLYTGITNDLEKRVDDHNLSLSGAKYTRHRRPVKLVWTEQSENRSEASKREIIVKKMTRKEKETLLLNQPK